MSLYAITQYQNELEKIIQYGGSKKETAIRNAFYYLLNEYARSKDLMLIAEISTKNKGGKIITPDGTLKDYIRNDWGYWESKDESDDIDEEIQKKFNKGYPSDNILFEDSQIAVLYQHGGEVMRVNMRDDEQLHNILTRFLQYERPDVHDFREAIEKFKEDIPKVTEAIRRIIEAEQKSNKDMQAVQAAFLAMCKEAINPDITADDVKEMMIQHILSADIFNTIFDEPHFHQENNIARELNTIIQTFFTGNVRRNTLGSIKHYYDTINARAATIADHHEKQKFLKIVYENFYKGYNPKAADRLGIVYTPNEIVNFMIRSTDYLLHKHFGKTLGDKNVEILDPATGTGTFICDIIDYLPVGKLTNKYKNELHANEVAILPYYIANLNIEYTYKQKTGKYEEFSNLCFVDTLDNTGFHWAGKQGSLFGVSAENAERIRRQNERRISVIIGNPPYNAKQENYNFQNANRAYREIDKRIKDSYIKQGTAQNQIVVYDMYTRFYRWAMDRLNDNGIIAFVTNRSFIDARALDGFRKIIQDEYDHAYIIDTKSDVRANPKIAGTTHNVFGIQTGVCVMFLVKSTHKQLKPHPCRIEYIALDDDWRKEEKWAWFAEHKIENIEFDNITPDRNNNWINQSENNWEELVPLIDKEAKAGKKKEAIFKLFANGLETGRDEWMFDLSEKSLLTKIKFYINIFNQSVNAGEVINSIKWNRDLKNLFSRKIKIELDKSKIRKAHFRPFNKMLFYADSNLNYLLTNFHYEMFSSNLNESNKVIAISGIGFTQPFHCLAFDTLTERHTVEKSQCLPLYRYNKEGQQQDNITDWALHLFNDYYRQNEPSSPVCYAGSSELRAEFLLDVPPANTICKEAIFQYVYAVLHHPAYRKKYELNLKREFPRIPLYDNFHQWAAWGKRLMDLHIHYETVAPYPLERNDAAVEQKAGVNLDSFFKPKLKANKESGEIAIDAITTLSNIPTTAWDYQLGNRSALEWILDQYKEKKPGDPTIAEHFNTYHFHDYKEHVINLLQRVCTVSVETIKIIGEMP
ncbi:DNA methyltransferase [Ilyomonas limi]|uniref:site-specific DNA-methyltransferase (adenine-specific) n=2 Tax=Ilyomonas limi TaxID=2575867 RepID=A0A4U3L476_9BACT|nr:DNA methyltransferase [Ilyomonas limi]